MATDNGIQATVDAIVATRTTLQQRASDTLQALEKSQADIDAAIELHGPDSDAVALLHQQHNVLRMQATFLLWLVGTLCFFLLFTLPLFL